MMGDETGMVKAFLADLDCIQENETIVLLNAIAKLNTGKIEIQMMKGGRIEYSKKILIQWANNKNNISAKPVDLEEDESQNQQ